MNKTLGVIGGIGPLATVYFLDLLVRKTDAATDQEHIDMVVLNHATIPDRTAFLLGKSQENPLPVMIEDAKKLEKLGVDYIVIPCNTAHTFFGEIQSCVGVPIVNIIEETCNEAKNAKTVGILATSGTIDTNSYQLALSRRGIKHVLPPPKLQEKVMEIIYDKVKSGKNVEKNEYKAVLQEMTSLGCDAIILGCTELSVVHRDLGDCGFNVLDSLEILATKTITLCGKKIKE